MCDGLGLSWSFAHGGDQREGMAGYGCVLTCVEQQGGTKRSPEHSTRQQLRNPRRPRFSSQPGTYSCGCTPFCHFNFHLSISMLTRPGTDVQPPFQPPRSGTPPSIPLSSATRTRRPPTSKNIRRESRQAE